MKENVLEVEYGDWQSALPERDSKEINYCRLYAAGFGHGTDGHNMRLIIAKLAAALDVAQKGGVEVAQLFGEKADGAS